MLSHYVLRYCASVGRLLEGPGSPGESRIPPGGTAVRVNSALVSTRYDSNTQSQLYSGNAQRML